MVCWLSGTSGILAYIKTRRLYPFYITAGLVIAVWLILVRPQLGLTIPPDLLKRADRVIE
ncbi:hypothetical protein CBM2598_U10108 [Cupriavidus taiwanensis]|nr:hypothetical protein CBM2598_U10108 [Cupriavidus taiwanensis]